MLDPDTIQTATNFLSGDNLQAVLALKEIAMPVVVMLIGYVNVSKRNLKKSESELDSLMTLLTKSSKFNNTLAVKLDDAEFKQMIEDRTTLTICEKGIIKHLNKLLIPLEKLIKHREDRSETSRKGYIEKSTVVNSLYEAVKQLSDLKQIKLDKLHLQHKVYNKFHSLEKKISSNSEHIRRRSANKMEKYVVDIENDFILLTNIDINQEENLELVTDELVLLNDEFDLISKKSNKLKQSFATLISDFNLLVKLGVSEVARDKKLVELFKRLISDFTSAVEDRCLDKAA